DTTEINGQDARLPHRRDACATKNRLTDMGRDGTLSAHFNPRDCVNRPIFLPCLKFAALLDPALPAAASFIAAVWRKRKVASVATSQRMCDANFIRICMSTASGCRS